ncbi:Threonylcarbamoyl-AMP synthase [Melia azedarach]|uniref:Threonylcarbamoyl-AMP synthase n=1 Tax=Melia azedarach TaxID=155640 RepID=A0ACC1YSN4_MELAZ|nr:Threonylcarbamoyl-AMP synthase [Melia azedarach]
MGFCHWKNLFTFLLMFSTFLASHQQQHAAAMRPLQGEQWVKKDGRVALQSLQRGPVPSSGNPCTYIPGQGSGSCTLNGMNIAGSVARAPPVFRDLVVKVGVAASGNNENETPDKDQSS